LTTIDFYFNADDRLQVACRLAGKALAGGQRVLVFAPQAELAQRLDRMLWTAPAIAFVPHCMAGDAHATDTPIVISGDAAGQAARDVLLNLSTECPPSFERYARLLEIVSRDEADRRGARERYAHYRDRGYAIRSHDLAKESAA
jgi:DNA polymerase-3 subunit chi